MAERFDALLCTFRTSRGLSEGNVFQQSAPSAQGSKIGNGEKTLYVLSFKSHSSFFVDNFFVLKAVLNPKQNLVGIESLKCLRWSLNLRRVT